MITTDQPTCFPENVLVAVSSRVDGTMLDRAMGVHDGTTVSNRTKFCEQNGVRYGDTVYQRIIYDESRSYALVTEVDTGSTTKYTSEVVGDALYTKTSGIAMMLPVADCVATVLYDPVQRALALVHLGRHSTYARLATRVVQHFIQDGTKPEDLIVWMSPHAQKTSYRLEWFDRSDDPEWHGYYEERDGGVYLDMAGYNTQLLSHAGVVPEHIYVSSVDTMRDEHYFSHAAGETSDRLAVLAALK